MSSEKDLKGIQIGREKTAVFSRIADSIETRFLCGIEITELLEIISCIESIVLGSKDLNYDELYSRINLTRQNASATRSFDEK